MWSFPYHQYTKFVSRIVTKSMTQVGATECKTRAIVCKHNYNFLCSARNLDCYASFVVVVSLLNKRIHRLHNVCDGSVQTWFDTVGWCRFWKFFVKKFEFPLRYILVHWRVGFFWNCNLPLPRQIYLLWKNVCKRTECIVWKQFSRSVRNQLCCKWIHC